MYRAHAHRLAALAAVSLAFPAAASAEPEKKPAGEKLICKSVGETGSLVRKRKQCFTRAEWDKIAESQRNGTQKMVDQLAERCGQPVCY